MSSNCRDKVKFAYLIQCSFCFNFPLQPVDSIISNIEQSSLISHSFNPLGFCAYDMNENNPEFEPSIGYTHVCSGKDRSVNRLSLLFLKF